MVQENVYKRLEELVKDPADGSLELADYITFIERYPDEAESKQMSMLGKILYLLTREKSKSPLAGKNIKVKGKLVNFRFGKEWFFYDVLYVTMRDHKGNDITFRRPFCSSNLENPTIEQYASVLERMKGKPVLFTAHYLAGYYFIEDVQNGTGVVKL